MSIETDFDEILSKLKTSRVIDDYVDNTAATNKPDFILNVGPRKIAIELKEKRKPYNLNNWLAFKDIGVVDERHAFIEDELSVRRLIYFGPYSHLIIKDVAQGDLRLFSLLDLFCAPRVRVNRPVYDSGNYKGKWLLGLRNATQFVAPDKLLRSVVANANKLDKYYGVGDDAQAYIMSCHGTYHGEILREGGVPRTAEYRNQDLRGK